MAKQEPFYGSESYTSNYRPDKSVYQDDTRIFHRGGFEYDSVEKVVGVEADGGALSATVELASGGRRCCGFRPWPMGRCV